MVGEDNPSGDTAKNKTDQQIASLDKAVIVNTQHERRMETLAWFAAGVGLVAALGGIFAAGFAGIQAYVSNQGNKVNREAFTAVQRAFVTVNQVKIVKAPAGLPDQNNQVMKVQGTMIIPIMKNTGNTPTKNLRFWAAASCLSPMTLRPRQAAHCTDMPLNIPLDPEELIGTISPGIAFLGQNAESPIAGVGTSLDTFQRVVAGDIKFFVFGIIRYNDIFPRTETHITKYCYQIIGDETGDIDFPTFSLCGHWNCGDADCNDDRKSYDVEVASAAARPIPQQPQTAPQPQQQEPNAPRPQERDPG
jgi:hypothetical protein